MRLCSHQPPARALSTSAPARPAISAHFSDTKAQGKTHALQACKRNLVLAGGRPMGTTGWYALGDHLAAEPQENGRVRIYRTFSFTDARSVAHEKSSWWQPWEPDLLFVYHGDRSSSIPTHPRDLPSVIEERLAPTEKRASLRHALESVGYVSTGDNLWRSRRLDGVVVWLPSENGPLVVLRRFAWPGCGDRPCRLTRALTTACAQASLHTLILNNDRGKQVRMTWQQEADALRPKVVHFEYTKHGLGLWPRDVHMLQYFN